MKSPPAKAAVGQGKAGGDPRAEREDPRPGRLTGRRELVVDVRTDPDGGDDHDVSLQAEERADAATEGSPAQEALGHATLQAHVAVSLCAGRRAEESRRGGSRETHEDAERCHAERYDSAE